MGRVVWILLAGWLGMAFPGADGQGVKVVQESFAFLGSPYRMGGLDASGIDCSGLVKVVFQNQGLQLPRTAAGLYQVGAPVAETDLRPGDLLFFRNTYKRGISHVGIYAGEGKFIHAASTRRGVVVTELSNRYYRLRYAGARRLKLPEPLAAEPAASSTVSVAAR